MGTPVPTAKDWDKLRFKRRAMSPMPCHQLKALSRTSESLNPENRRRQQEAEGETETKSELSLKKKNIIQFLYGIVLFLPRLYTWASRLLSIFAGLFLCKLFCSVV
jgi:hypothetical protein